MDFSDSEDKPLNKTNSDVSDSESEVKNNETNMTNSLYLSEASEVTDDVEPVQNIDIMNKSIYDMNTEELDNINETTYVFRDNMNEVEEEFKKGVAVETDDDKSECENESEKECEEKSESEKECEEKSDCEKECEEKSDCEKECEEKSECEEKQFGVQIVVLKENNDTFPWSITFMASVLIVLYIFKFAVIFSELAGFNTRKNCLCLN
jgi:hypothetical protein